MDKKKKVAFFKSNYAGTETNTGYLLPGRSYASRDRLIKHVWHRPPTRHNPAAVPTFLLATANEIRVLAQLHLQPRQHNLELGI